MNSRRTDNPVSGGQLSSSGTQANRHDRQGRWTVDIERIERARVLRAWTRKQLAGVAHVNRKTLTELCNGRRRPSFGTIQAICTALGLSVTDVLVFDDGEGDP